MDTNGSVLLLQVPRTNDKKALAAEQMFASLQGLLVQPPKNFFGQAIRERLSFEIAVIDQRIGFYIWVPTYLKDFVQEQIYAQYPNVQISEVEDYAQKDPGYSIGLMSELRLKSNDALPIKTFQSFEVDPLAAITATLAKFTDQEEAWLQLIIRPASEKWHQKNEHYLAGLKGGKSISSSGLLKALWAPPEYKEEAPKLNEYDRLRAGGAEEKAQKLAYETVLRIVYRGNTTPQQANLRMQSIAASYKQFNTTYLNGFVQSRAVQGSLFTPYITRAFGPKGFVLNIEEVATLYHLPHTTVETPFILWASSQTAEPPANLPLVTDQYRPDISPVAATNFRGQNTAFGLPRSDRGRHLYILGQTGVGKSGLLELLTISDIYSEYGFAIIDPHGDYAQSILRRIPEERIKDVVYFNAADMDFPIAFNPLEVYDPKLKTHTCSELIGVLKRLFDSWGPRLEYILRYTILALLDYPNATMLDITRMLTEKKFRNEVLQYVTDPVVRNFWLIEFASWNDKFAAEAVAPVLNKVGAFTANPLVRNIIGQSKSSFNIRDIMDQRKILIVNLTRGLVGEDNAALLGALIVTKMQMAAMSRADIEGHQRVPFYLYVDEFQNFATDSFATILSEARKYGLYLTVANQYIAQMMPTVKDAVFGNVGSIITFRTSADDARTMMSYFEPRFTDHDIIHMHNRSFIISMTIDGEKVQAFSGVSLELPPLGTDYTQHIIAASRQQYGTQRELVELTVHTHYHPPQAATPQKPKGPNQNESPKNRKAEKAPAQQPAANASRQQTAPVAPAAPQTPATSSRLPHFPVSGLGRLIFRRELADQAQPILQPRAAAPAQTPAAPAAQPVANTEPQPLSGTVILNPSAEASIELHPRSATQTVTATGSPTDASPAPAAEQGSDDAPAKRRRRRRRRKSPSAPTE